MTCVLLFGVSRDVIRYITGPTVKFLGTYPVGFFPIRKLSSLNGKLVKVRDVTFKVGRVFKYTALQLYGCNMLPN